VERDPASTVSFGLATQRRQTIMRRMFLAGTMRPLAAAVALTPAAIHGVECI
jgi:hypothetical protein